MKNAGLKSALFLGAYALLTCNVLADGGPPVSMPDGGSSMLLLVISLVGIGAARKFLNRKP